MELPGTTMYAVTLVVFFVTCTMMLRASTALISATQIILAVLARVAVAVTGLLTLVAVTAAGLWTLTLALAR